MNESIVVPEPFNATHMSTCKTQWQNYANFYHRVSKPMKVTTMSVICKKKKFRKLSVWDHVEKYTMQQCELVLTLFSQADGIDMSFL